MKYILKFQNRFSFCWFYDLTISSLVFQYDISCLIYSHLVVYHVIIHKVENYFVQRLIKNPIDQYNKIYRVVIYICRQEIGENDGKELFYGQLIAYREGVVIGAFVTR